MPKTEKTPATVLQSLIDEYQINAFYLSKSTHIDYQTIRKILNGTGKIRVPTALKLSKFFGQSPDYFVLIQYKAIANELSNNKTYTKQLSGIKKVQKPTGKTKAKGKTKTLSEKRKKAAKVPGARRAKRSRTKK
jgi:plasmid maintenance system antidote protein VapI